LSIPGQCRTIVRNAANTFYNSPHVLSLSLHTLLPAPLAAVAGVLPTGGSDDTHAVCAAAPLAPLSLWRLPTHGDVPWLLCDAFVLPSFTEQAKLLVMAVAAGFAVQVGVLFLRDLFSDLAVGRWMKAKAD
jgi:hypothetical protein